MFLLLAAALLQPPACAAAAPADSLPPLPREAVVLQTHVGVVNGTLLLPAAAPGQRPAVALLIAGSGPTDRDGNSRLIPGGPASLRLLAESLARCGIATLRYDKRGIAASPISADAMRALRFDDYVDDAAAWLERLRADRRFARVVVVGHSEGALIGAIAAARVPGTAVVSISGAGKPAADILHDQLATRLPPPLAARADSILAELRAGRLVDSVPPVLRSVFDPSVQAYEISWFRYDPPAALARVAAPVLVVQGTNDIQVSVDNARRLAAVPGARLVLVDSMTHVLKLAGSDQAAQMRTYTDGSLPLAPALVRAVVDFIASPAPPPSSPRR